MLTFRVRVKLALLLILVLSTLGLNKARACDLQHCQPLYKDGQLMGYGCAGGSGGYIECFATVEGCTIIYCAD